MLTRVTTTAATTSITPRPRRSRRLRPPGPKVGGRARLAIAATGILLVALSIPRIVSGSLIFSHEPVMRLVQRGADIPLDQLVAARRAYEAAIGWHAGANERAALAILRLRLALALGVDTPGGRAVLEAARDAA